MGSCDINVEVRELYGVSYGIRKQERGGIRKLNSGNSDYRLLIIQLYSLYYDYEI